MNVRVPTAAETQANSLAALIKADRRFRAATQLDELAFALCNEVTGVLAYRQAMLLGRGEVGRTIFTLSGAVAPGSDAPFALWVKRLLGNVQQRIGSDPLLLGAQDMPEALATQWNDWLPPLLVCVPLRQGEVVFGVVVYGREAAPTDMELQMLRLMAESASYCWGALVQGGQVKAAALQPRKLGTMALAALAAVLVLALVPVRSAVLAPAEVIAKEPTFLRAPLEGVIEQLSVAPNQAVVEGQSLGRYDQRRLRTQLEVARRTALALEAEVRQLTVASISDVRARAAMPGVEGRLQAQLAELDFLQQQLSRVELRAPQAGVAVYDNPSEWVGRPVAVGERIMQLADPNRVELEIRVPVADVIEFGPGSQALFFRNIDPDAPVPARLVFLSYRATPGQDGVLGYRMRASFDEGVAPLRIGLKGVSKVYGPRVSLGYYILRRPLAALRTSLGL